jgi:hypothetical protein
VLFLLFSTVGFHQLRFLQEYFKAVESPTEGRPRGPRDHGTSGTRGPGDTRTFEKGQNTARIS